MTPVHTHTREDQTVYVLDGAITAFVGNQPATSKPVVPRDDSDGDPHKFGLQLHDPAAPPDMNPDGGHSRSR